VNRWPAATSASSGSTAKAKAAEGQKVLQKLKSTEQVIALDERGRHWSTAELADRMREWQAAGSDVSLVIGGPDGIATDCLARADLCWSLSKLTLPHGLARVVVAEQLYRAWTVITGHPYHRA
jgi:23S rRNA (pseudouridine1915-N3)-methyltransferase